MVHPTIRHYTGNLGSNMGTSRILKGTWVLMVTLTLWMVMYSKLSSLTHAPYSSSTDESMSSIAKEFAHHEQHGAIPDEIPNNYNKLTVYFNCQNIKDIYLANRLGSGISKSGFLGLYGGQKVVVRMTSHHNVDSSRCLIEKDLDRVHFNKTHECLRLGAVRLMREIVMLQQLDHPGITKLLGYCIRSEEVTSMNLGEHGAIVVSEYGQVLNNTIVESWTLRERLEKALQIMDLFLYLEHSPLGSIEYPDFKLWHFVILNGQIKAIDFDDATSLEPLCPEPVGNFQAKCIFDLPCVEGRCHGYNAKVNMWRFNSTFTPLLFPEPQINELPALSTIATRIKRCDITAWELKTMLEEVLRKGHLA